MNSLLSISPRCIFLLTCSLFIILHKPISGENCENIYRPAEVKSDSNNCYQIADSPKNRIKRINLQGGDIQHVYVVDSAESHAPTQVPYEIRLQGDHDQYQPIYINSAEPHAPKQPTFGEQPFYYINPAGDDDQNQIYLVDSGSRKSKKRKYKTVYLSSMDTASTSKSFLDECSKLLSLILGNKHSGSSSDDIGLVMLLLQLLGQSQATSGLSYGSNTLETLFKRPATTSSTTNLDIMTLLNAFINQNQQSLPKVPGAGATNIDLLALLNAIGNQNQQSIQKIPGAGSNPLDFYSTLLNLNNQNRQSLPTYSGPIDQRISPDISSKLDDITNLIKNQPLFSGRQDITTTPSTDEILKQLQMILAKGSA